MKIVRVIILLLLTTNAIQSTAQQSEEQVRQNAIGFYKKNDFSNALVVLNSGLKNNPGSLVLAKELAFTYYLSGALEQAAESILPLVDRIDADIQTFQIAGNIFNGLEQWKQSEKIYKKGLKKYPQSGQLHSEYGQLLWELEKPNEAIEQWERGIVDDPSYSGNYYHAAKFYYAAADKVRSIIYGEIFVNIESLSTRTEEIKYLLFESYKRIYNPDDVKVHYIKKTTAFETLFLKGILSYSHLASKGITVSSLYEIRLGFMKAWFASDNALFPFSLFDRMKYMIDNELFEAYNQWLFGFVSEGHAAETWATKNSEMHSRYLKFQQNNLFHPKKGEFYF